MISLVINLDTRPGFMEDETVQGTMLSGTRSLDFITEGVKNKVKFFEGHDLETTVFIDIHDPLPKETLDWLVQEQAGGIIDNLVFNRHTERFLGEFFPKWNDLSFLNAIMLSRADFVCHMDGDMNAFINDKTVITEWLQWLDEGKYSYISYPSVHSPAPVVDPRFKTYWWASTRFFLAKRMTTILSDPGEIINCLMDSEYMYGTYGSPDDARCPWLEHVLGITADSKEMVFYPPIQPNRYLIFAWSRYYSGVLKHLNGWPYEKVVEYAKHISYPCDVSATKIGGN